MGDGTKDNPYTREDVLRLIKENGGTAAGLDLSGKVFKEGIDLNGLNLAGIILNGARFPPKIVLADLEPNMRPDESRTVKKIIGANLQGVDFSKALLRSTYLWEADLQKAKFYYCDMQKAYLVQTKLQETDLSWAQLQGANFEGAYFYKTDLHGAEFDSATSFNFAQWADYMLGEEGKGLFGLAEDTYRRLKQWYTNAGVYGIAGEFFFREMTAQRKTIKWWPQPWHRLWSKFVSLICGYGERPRRVVVWAASWILALAAAYYLFGGLTPLYSLYYSAVSFTALGYGTWAYTPPEAWVQGVGAAESFIGVFTIALFLVTFTRKMRR